MTTSIRILSTLTLDSFPSVILVSSDGSKTLINCGEGCQRTFLESSSPGAGGLRVRTVTRVCLTHIAHSSVGGLPGMVLTTADAADAARSSALAAAEKNSQLKDLRLAQDLGKTSLKKHNAPRFDQQNDDLHTPGLDIIGPNGTRKFLHSLRHFMRRDRFQLKVNEGAYKQDPKSAPRKKSGKRGKNKDNATFDGFYIETIPLVHKITVSDHTMNSSIAANIDDDTGAPQQKRPRMEADLDTEEISTEVLSFVFTTPPLLGKFLPEKARELGIPAGPLYAQLKSGKSVTFRDPFTGKERTVQSSQVVTQGSPGIAVVVVYCPSLYVLQQLKDSDVLKRFCSKDDGQLILDVMIHMVPCNVFDTQKYKAWVKQFPESVEHIFLESSDILTTCGKQSGTDEDGSPFHSAAIGAITRSLLHKEIFPAPVPEMRKPENPALTENERNKRGGISQTLKASGAGGIQYSDISIIRGKPLMEYVLIPRSKKGVVQSTYRANIAHGIDDEEWKEIFCSAKTSGAPELAQKILREIPQSNEQGSKGECGELIFTGTGSAIPCKTRNVTGMYVRMKNGKAILLDVGESTTGQLLRTKQRDETDEDFPKLLCDIKAVWISHPHADHHLGILRFLTERNAVCGMGNDPIILMAPPNMFLFLSEYSDVDPLVKDSYIPLDCQDMVAPKTNPLGDKLYNDLGITGCVAVPVAHCRHSFAVVIDGTSFGRLAYSGDCRPSTRFADIGIDTDLLIHEATFEDGMEEEASVKRHCTVGEALGVGRQMKAKAVVLTHFSQRYPRIPPLNGNYSSSYSNVGDDQTGKCSSPKSGTAVPVIFAFDFMKLTPDNIETAAKLTPALRLLYPDDAEEGVGCENTPDECSKSGVSAKEILSVPGVFAQKQIL